MRGGHPIVVIVLAQVLVAVLAHHSDKALVIAVRTRDAARLDVADPHLLYTLVVMLVAAVVLLTAHAHGSDHGPQALSPALCRVAGKVAEHIAAHEHLVDRQLLGQAVKVGSGKGNRRQGARIALILSAILPCAVGHMHQPIGGEEPVSVFLTIGKLELARLRVKIRVAVQRAVQPLAAVRSAVIKSAALPVIARKNKARDGFTRLLSFFIVGGKRAERRIRSDHGLAVRGEGDCARVAQSIDMDERTLGCIPRKQLAMRRLINSLLAVGCRDHDGEVIAKIAIEVAGR